MVPGSFYIIQILNFTEILYYSEILWHSSLINRFTHGIARLTNGLARLIDGWAARPGPCGRRGRDEVAGGRRPWGPGRAPSH